MVQESSSGAVVIPYHSPSDQGSYGRKMLRTALRNIYPDGTNIRLDPVEREQARLIMPAPRAAMFDAFLVKDIEAQLWNIQHELPWRDERTLFLDLETHNEGKQWGMHRDEFVRLGQYAWGFDGQVHLTTDFNELRRLVESADGVIAHNGHNFDWSVLYGKDSTVPLELARDGKLLDTMVFANLAYPIHSVYVNRDGKHVTTSAKPVEVLKWLALDNLAFQLGVPGKIGNLRELAKKYNPPKTLVADLDYSLIPLDDPEFLAYAEQDIVALQEVTRKLLLRRAPSEYDWREQTVQAIYAQMSRNGFTVDVPAAEKHLETLQLRRDELLLTLQRDYAFPTTGKAPWRSKAGVEAIRRILADYGITPETRPNWTKTATGNTSLGGQVLIDLTQGTEAEDLGAMLAELMGQRPLVQQALDYLQPDGKVHSQITAFQRSGRTSVTKCGWTTWSAREGKTYEKHYLIPSPGRKLLEADLSNADQRIVAALSQDLEYAKNFEEGVDGHEITGRMVFGNAIYDSDPGRYRQISKIAGHGYAYGSSAGKIAVSLDIPIHTAKQFVAGMKAAYPAMTQWQTEVRREGESGGVLNPWGRYMPIERYWDEERREVRSRSYTQAPALLGQSGTTEVMKDGLVEMLHKDIRLIQWVVTPVHDALVLDVPEEELDYAQTAVKDCMEQMVNGIEFPLKFGEAAETWEQAGH